MLCRPDWSMLTTLAWTCAIRSRTAAEVGLALVGLASTPEAAP